MNAPHGGIGRVVSFDYMYDVVLMADCRATGHRSAVLRCPYRTRPTQAPHTTRGALVSHVPARPRRSARQDKSLAHEAQTTVSDPALQGRVAGLGRFD